MYRNDLDIIKGVSIISVVLFHMGMLKSGYLGVDAFLVINGFLIIPSVFGKIIADDFSYFIFLEKRFLRLFPLVVIASIISLLLGWAVMMPDHLENLSQSIIAANAMSTNILSSITTRDYWNMVNDYKPLMHLWYVGIIFEFYVLCPIILLITQKIALKTKTNIEKSMLVVLCLLTFISLLLFLLPEKYSGDKFYMLPSRFFEFGFGGIIGLFFNKASAKEKRNKRLYLFVVVMLTFIIFSSVITQLTDPDAISTPIVGDSNHVFSDGLLLAKPVMLLLTVFLTCLLVGLGSKVEMSKSILAKIGNMSFSIFIWHQVFLAFYRYVFTDKLSSLFIICFLIIIVVVSTLSYLYIEKIVRTSHKNLIIWLCVSLCVVVPSVWMYQHAGVTKDIPELDVKYGQTHRGMFAEYCDRVYNYDDDFKNSGKIKVLIVGVSFARDFANVLLESTYKDSIQISYSSRWEEKYLEKRIKDADIIFSFSSKEEVPPYVWEKKREGTSIWGIGSKNYGACLGNIYVHRNSDRYFKMTVEPVKGYIELNDIWKKQWGKYYIDFLTPVLTKEGRVKVFTPNNKYIAPDGEHLCRAGALWYASVFNLERIFNTISK